MRGGTSDFREEYLVMVERPSKRQDAQSAVMIHETPEKIVSPN
jgi:hypothetical protein